MTVFGIDPGLSGGIAAWSHVGREDQMLTVFPMPRTEPDINRRLCALMSRELDWVAYIEQVPWIVAGPKQNAASRAKLHRNVGVLHGILLALEVRIIPVPPKEWQAFYHFGARGDRTQTEWKNLLKQEAQRRFPTTEVTLATADALLLLEYGRNQEKGRQV